MDPRIKKGMERQFETLQAKLDKGDKLIGWKVGFGAPAAMERLGIATPLMGFLTEAGHLPSGAALQLGDFAKAVVEPEIAVTMGQDLGSGASADEVRAAIAGLSPAIEIANFSFPPDDVETILAGNIYQRGVIFGAMDPARAGANVGGLAGSLAVDGQTRAETSDVEANTGRLTDLVALVANTLAAFGHTLSAGQRIIGGSIVPPVFVDQPGNITYRLAPYDALAVAFKAS